MSHLTSPQKSPLFTLPELRVVEASAGSGKTYALAKRYVQLLLNSEISVDQVPVQNILALTFTNKAAFEMKARILLFLKSIALNKLSQQDTENILGPLDLKPDVAQQKAYLIMDSIIHHYHFFQVQTIDKFINTLLSGCAFKIGLTSSFKIKTTALEYLQYGLDRLIDQATFDPKILSMFERFLDNYLYLENRKGWFPKADILDVVKALYDQNNIYGLGFESSAISAQNLSKSKNAVLNQMRSLKEILPEKVNATFRKSLDRFLDEHDYGFDIDRVPNFSKENPPLNKGAEASEEVFQLWFTIQRSLQKICLEEAYSLFNPYIDVFDKVMNVFYKQAAKDDILFLEELNKRARHLFDAQGITVEELYFRLATRIRHYLIDEFQDTSRLQWSNIRMMPEEALSTGGSLFYVGDRKQAIYGFRGGDYKLFDDIKHEFNTFVQSDTLVENYRSHKQIVDFNNEVFSVNNLNRFFKLKEDRDKAKKISAPVEFHGDDYRQLANIFATSKQNVTSGHDKGYVAIEAVRAESKEKTDAIIHENILSILSELRQRFPLKDIAILTRNNSQVEAVTRWLLSDNIRVESERTVNVKENPRIGEIICLLKFLDSPIDNVSFALFLMSDVFVRVSGISAEEYQAFIFEHRADLLKKDDFYLYQAFRKRYPDVWAEYLEEFYRNVGLYPLYELVVSIYERYKCVSHFYDDHGFFMHFLELIKKREEEHSDISSFLEYFDNLQGESLFVKISGQDAVRIMTVHKAKGLEFSVVIIPFLSMDIQVGAKSSEKTQSYVLQKKSDMMKLLRLKKTYFRYSDELYQIYREEYKNSFISELNNVYVALTRASHELYAFMPEKVGRSFNLVNLLIPEHMYNLGKKSQYAPKEIKKEPGTMLLDSTSHHNWIYYLNDEHLANEQSETYQARVEGMVMHAALSKIENLHDKSSVDAVRQAVQLTANEYARVDDNNELEKKVMRVINEESLKKFFVIPDGSVLTEKEVVNRYGHTKRIDRLIVNKEEVWIVDYKASRAESARGVLQVKEYKEILATLYLESKIRGFLMYLDELNAEEVYG